MLSRAVALPLSVVAFIRHFNMATFYKDGDPACDASNWDTSQKPSSFAPTNLNISNWIENYKYVGARSGILTAKHGCGFFLWPTNVTLPSGENYGYHVGGAGGIGVDVVGEFAAAMQAAGLPHSYYYSLKDSFYLNAISDNVRPASTALPGQVVVTQDQFENISLAAITELWSRYGDLQEIWFDGGISQRISSRVVPLLKQLQPNAIAMGAGITNSPNDADWVGTESGMPQYPVWSTGCCTVSGGGSTGVSPTTATDFCPKVGDCTLQAPDKWFWEPNAPIKSLAQMVDIYHGTVGQNCVMELDFAVDRTGNIDPTHSARYKEFGDWIRKCYGTPLASTGTAFAQTMQLNLTVTKDPAGATVDRVTVREDLSKGQVGGRCWWLLDDWHNVNGFAGVLVAFL
jgi:alpha-L-fucosidase